MGLRGDALHTHILDTAKLVFLETGYERTSMDTVAARAATSKRSLYAHFPTKEALFQASVERSHDLFENRLGTPSTYAPDAQEAAVLFVARVRQLMSYGSIVRMCRVGIAEAEHLPAAASRIHESFVAAAATKLAGHLREHCGVDDADAVATRVLGAAVYPFLTRALFGLEELSPVMPDQAKLAAEVDVPAVRRIVESAFGT